MTEKHKILIKLISVSLGHNSIELPTAEIDWKNVAELASLHEVDALAFDGYQQIHGLLGKQSLPQEDLLEWIGQTLMQESQYKQQLDYAKELAVLYANKNICTYILKGFSIAQYYPKPNHRFSCDFDCFLVKDRESAQEEGNKLVEERGVEVDKSYYKNSSFVFEGLPVENHRYCCSIKRGKRTVNLESYLESLLFYCLPEYLEGSKLALPPLLFQAIFLIEHACGHFLYEKMSIKNICDWACFRKVNQNQLDWNEFYKASEKYSLLDFVYTMNNLADFILGKRRYSELSKIDKRVLEDTLKNSYPPQNNMMQRLWKTIGILRSGWKFRHFSGDSMIKELGHSAYSYLFEMDPSLGNYSVMGT